MSETVKSDEVTSEVSVRAEGWVRSAQAAIFEGITEREACGKLLATLRDIEKTLPKSKKSRNGWFSFMRLAEEKYESFEKPVPPKIPSFDPDLNVFEEVDKLTEELKSLNLEDDEKELIREDTEIYTKLEDLKSRAVSTIRTGILKGKSPIEGIKMSLREEPPELFTSSKGKRYLVLGIYEIERLGHSKKYSCFFTLGEDVAGISHKQCAKFLTKRPAKRGAPTSSYSKFKEEGVVVGVRFTALYQQKTLDRSLNSCIVQREIGSAGKEVDAERLETQDYIEDGKGKIVPKED